MTEKELEKNIMTKQTLIIPYSEEYLKETFQEKEQTTLRAINEFIEKNEGKLYLDIINKPFIENSKILFAIFNEENEKRFIELMKYAHPDLSPVGHLIYSEEARKEIYKKRDDIINYFREKGQNLAISGHHDFYSLISLNNKGFADKERMFYLYNLRIKNESKVLNEMLFRNGRTIYTIEDIIN